MRPLARKVVILLVISFFIVGLYAKYRKPRTCSAYYNSCYASQAKCVKGKCHCTGLYLGDGRTCRKANSCPKNVKCGSNARCMIDPKKPKTTICVCNPGYWENEAGDCLESCTKNQDCHQAYSICERTMCTCKQELILGEKSCEPAPLHECKTDKDCNSNAKCEGGKCQCQGKYVGNGKNCRASKPCSDKKAKERKCDSEETCLVDPLMPRHPVCKCKPGLRHNTAGKCVECLSDENCKKTNSICVQGDCTCKDELILGETSCEAAPLHTCQADTDCDSRAKCEEGKCICQGKTIGNGKYCRDTLVCSAGHQCGDDTICVIDPLLPDKQECRCREGFTKPVNGTSCEDVDECSNAGTCSENSVCKNSAGSYDCKCNDGYRKNELNDNCEDVDECSEIVDACGTGEECVNEQGKYSCECASGYEKKNGACVKKDQCNCKKHEVCYKGKCKCKKGYKKDKQGHCYRVKISKGLLAGSGDSIHVSSYPSALILGMLGRLAFTA